MLSLRRIDGKCYALEFIVVRGYAPARDVSTASRRTSRSAQVTVFTLPAERYITQIFDSQYPRLKWQVCYDRSYKSKKIVVARRLVCNNEVILPLEVVQFRVFALPSKDMTTLPARKVAEMRKCTEPAATGSFFGRSATLSSRARHSYAQAATFTKAD